MTGTSVRADRPSCVDTHEGIWSCVQPLKERFAPASDRQEKGALYFIADAPETALIGAELASKLLSARSYLIGLVAELERRGTPVHPREAAYHFMSLLVDEPIYLRCVTTWNNRRYREDAGPARIRATRHYDALSNHLATKCTRELPDQKTSKSLIHGRLRERGLSPLIDSETVEITYESRSERTRRRVSSFSFHWNYPDWAAYLLNPADHMFLSGYCHLRQAQRTFHLGGIKAARRVG